MVEKILWSDLKKRKRKRVSSVVIENDFKGGTNVENEPNYLDKIVENISKNRSINLGNNELNPFKSQVPKYMKEISGFDAKYIGYAFDLDFTSFEYNRTAYE